jgi:hypothetical protein
MAKNKIAVTIETPLPAKKRKGKPGNPTGFKPGNEHRFRSGQSGNPSGRPKDETRLLSKAIRGQLGTRAPDEVSEALGLSRGASWAQCIAASLVRRAVLKGDLGAVNILLAASEPTTRAGLDALMDADGGSVGPELHVHLISAQHRETVQPTMISANLEGERS